MKSEALEKMEKKLLELFNHLRQNIIKHPEMDGVIGIFIHLRTGGLIDYQIITEENKKFLK